MRKALSALAWFVMLVFAIAGMMSLLDTPPPQVERTERVCLRSLSGFVPAHQGFYTTTSGEEISYAIPDQQTTHCIEWSK